MRQVRAHFERNLCGCPLALLAFPESEMRKQSNLSRVPTARPFAGTQAGLSVPDVERLANSWLLDCGARQLSPGTIDNRRRATSKLVWFLRDQEHAACGPDELRGFLAYVNRAHESA